MYRKPAFTFESREQSRQTKLLLTLHTTLHCTFRVGFWESILHNINPGSSDQTFWVNTLFVHIAWEGSNIVLKKDYKTIRVERSGERAVQTCSKHRGAGTGVVYLPGGSGGYEPLPIFQTQNPYRRISATRSPIAIVLISQNVRPAFLSE